MISSPQVQTDIVNLQKHFMKFKERLNQLRDKLFQSIHSNNLIYNTCWEDPRVDRQLLELDNSSTVVMITSAGCNALEYLLDNPTSIECIDLNNRQNALLELKMVLLKYAEFKDLYRFFGDGRHKRAQTLYEDLYRKHLSLEARDFWDEKLDYFSGKAEKKKSFYFRGTSGQFAWFFNRYLSTKAKTKERLNSLLDAQTLQEQSIIYNGIESKIFGKVVKWVISRQTTMSLLGVPRAQREMITANYQGGISEYVLQSLRRVFTKLDIQDNYFWRVYITGSYTKSCSPEYLKEKNKEVLKSRVSKISLHTSSISQFLENKPSNYSHFILLDHQDWLAAYNQQELEYEWNLILRNSSSGSKYLLRSAHINPEFIPEFVLKQCHLEEKKVSEYAKFDRVGTYASTILLTRK